MDVELRAHFYFLHFKIMLHWTALVAIVIAAFLLLDADPFLFLAPDPPSDAFNDQGNVIPC